MEELRNILEKFVSSGWDLISIPSKEYLRRKDNKKDLIIAIEEANKQCGSCGCEFDILYKKALNLLK